MIEYKVRMSDRCGPDDSEEICNRMAQDGWRLVSTAAAQAGGIYLFFERGVEARDRLEDAVATMDAGERRELMDVAVAQADREPPR